MKRTVIGEVLQSISAQRELPAMLYCVVIALLVLTDCDYSTVDT